MRPPRIAPTSCFTGGLRWEVPSHVDETSATIASICCRSDPGRTAPEPTVARQQLRGDDDGTRLHPASMPGRTRTSGRALFLHDETVNRISKRTAAIAPSPHLAVDAKAKALKAAGENVIGFGAGEPDFPTPDHIVEAAVAACRDPKNHRYTPAGGLPELKEAIAAKTMRDSGFQCTGSQVLVTNGGKHAVFTAFAVLCDPGDEVICPAPYWTTYPEAIALAGGVPVVVETSDETGFKVTVDQLEAARTERTKAVLFVSPDNPSGSVYTPAEIAAIAEWALEHGVWVVTDEIYEHLTYGPHEFASMPTLVPDIAEQCIVLNGVAKTYAMTGLASRLDDRSERRHQGGDQLPEPRHVERLQRRAAGRARRRCRRSRRRGDDARRVRAAWHDDAPHAVRDPRRDLHRTAGRVLLLPERVRACSAAARRRDRPTTLELADLVLEQIEGGVRAG